MRITITGYIALPDFSKAENLLELMTMRQVFSKEKITKDMFQVLSREEVFPYPEQVQEFCDRFDDEEQKDAFLLMAAKAGIDFIQAGEYSIADVHDLKENEYSIQLRPCYETGVVGIHPVLSHDRKKLRILGYQTKVYGNPFRGFYADVSVELDLEQIYQEFLGQKKQQAIR